MGKPDDPGLSDPRLGQSATTVRDNLLIPGDALNTLTGLSRLSEFVPEYLGKVRLAYWNPPFDTPQSFPATMTTWSIPYG